MRITFLERRKWLYKSDWRGVNLQQTTSTICENEQKVEITRDCINNFITTS